MYRLTIKIFMLPLVFFAMLAVPVDSYSLEFKKVLLLQSYHSGYKWSDDINSAIQNKLTRKSGIDLRIEYLDTKRYFSEKYLALIKNTLLKKYQNTDFDLIICVDNNALNFLLNNRNELFTDIPIVFCGINFFDRAMLKGQTNITGVSEEVDIQKNIELMLDIHPKTRKIVVVNDDTTTGRIFSLESQNIARNFKTIEWYFTQNLTFNELGEKLSRLEEGDLVLQSLFIKDREGVFLEYDIATSFITRSSKVPVYSLWDFNLGLGVAGGLMVSGRYQGEAAAELAVQILQGVPADEIPVIMVSPNHYFADYSVLEKMKIDASHFPEETTFINKPETLYAKYKIQIWFAGIVVAVLFMTSLILFITVAKRRVAEAKLLKLTDELDERVKERTRELSRANVAIQRREEDIKRLIGNLSGAVYRCKYDDFWTMVFISEAITDLTGYKAEEIIDNTLLSYNELIFEKDRERLRETTIKAINRREKFAYEYRIKAKDGSIKWVWEQGSAIFDEEGNVLYLDGFITDISERKEYEKNQAKLIEAVHQTDDLIIITDLSGAIEYANPTFEKTTGYTSEEVIGKNPRLLKSGRQSNDVYREMWQTLLAGQVFSGRFINSRKDGSEYTAQVTISPIKDKNGEIVNYVGVQKDITHEIVMEQNLRQSQKLEAMGTLAGGIAHEINTPAQFVGSNLEFILESLPDLTDFIEACHTFSKQQEGEGKTAKNDIANLYEENDIEYLMDEIPIALEQSKDGIDQISKIVRSMKQFAHPGQEVAKATDINEALENTATVCRNEWKFHADIKYDLDKNLPMVPCHQSEINQVFLNLIINAAHAIESSRGEGEKGTIVLRTKAEDDFVEVQIEDDGQGIPEDIQSSIFDPFFTTKEPGKGTGQGLAIAFSIVKEKHGGEISFESTPEKGTTFIVRLPRSQEKKAEEKA